MSTAIGMSVTDETIIFLKDTFGYGFLPGAFFFAPANGDYFSYGVTS